MKLTPLTAVGIVALVALTPACTTQVAAGCDVDGDCAVRCEADHDDLPGGLCTVSCKSNDDCPMGTLCIDIRDGICVLECSSHQQCMDFGRDYVCQDRRDTHDRLQLVCLGL